VLEVAHYLLTRNAVEIAVDARRVVPGIRLNLEAIVLQAV
jgi:hypothetical protein